MTSGNGINASKALEILATLGHDREQVVAALGCHPRTARRWELGQHQPSRRYRAALQALIGDLLVEENAAARNARSQARANRLELAREALLTDADRAERAKFETEMKVRYAAIRAERDQRPMPERIAAAVTAIEKRPVRSPFQSVTQQMDPFAVVTQDKDLAMVEAAF